MSDRGVLITFEGIDGCGKSTQLRLAKDWLCSNGVSCLATHEPGATPLGREIRQLLLASGRHVTAEAELLLFLADRAQHVREQLAPALVHNRVVLCDRYSDSTHAYQMAARKLGQDERMLALLAFAECGVHPDLTLWFDVSVDVAWHRMQQRQKNGGEHSRFDLEARSFHQRVAEGFAQLARQYPDRIRRIDASQGIEHVHCQVRMEIESFLEARG
ncbi:MAG: dTMP kinase [Zetaproteobacteria bacterium]|nr:MAG: dTMP kinase [Zetaproteobacteria bacterium]